MNADYENALQAHLEEVTRVAKSNGAMEYHIELMQILSGADIDLHTRTVILTMARQANAALDKRYKDKNDKEH